MRTLIIATAAITLAATVANAETFPVITNQTVLQECGDCHMAYPPQTLPKRLWGNMINNLADHFGEDASLDPARVAEISTYYKQNASDVSAVRAAKKWRASGTFTRISDAPRFVKKHGTCAPAVWTHEKVKSKANCLACHSTMQTDGSTRENISFLPVSLQRKCGDD